MRHDGVACPLVRLGDNIPVVAGGATTDEYGNVTACDAVVLRLDGVVGPGNPVVAASNVGLGDGVEDVA